jgi:uncharacterized membrane protein
VKYLFYALLIVSVVGFSLDFAITSSQRGVCGLLVSSIVGLMVWMMYILKEQKEIKDDITRLQ